jgi:hypothetical protein
MEVEQILSTLNEKLGQTSLSKRTISDYVNANLPAEGAEFEFDKHVGILKSLGGNFSADVAAQVAEFKKNYKPAPAINKEEPGNNGTGENDALLKRLEQLEAKLDESGKTATRKELTTAAIGKGESLKVANKAIWEDAVKAVTVEDNDTAETVVTKAKTIYESQLRRIIGDSATPYNSTGRTGANKEAEEEAKRKREAFKEQQRKAGRLPKKEN